MPGGSEGRGSVPQRLSRNRGKRQGNIVSVLPHRWIRRNVYKGLVLLHFSFSPTVCCIIQLHLLAPRDCFFLSSLKVFSVQILQ